MEATSIILTVCIFILIYVLYYYVWSTSSMLMKNVTPGTQATTIDVSKIDTGSNVGAANFTYSLWFNINDWNYHYGEKKPLFRRLSTGVNEYCPYVYFDSYTNDLVIEVAVINPSPTTLTPPTPPTTTTTCKVQNVPIQKWVHLLISVYGKSLDTYINGKLVSTCILGGVPKLDATKQITICPDIGFNGWVTRFEYWADSTDPQTVWNKYKDGNGTGIFSSMFGNYGLKLALMNGSVEQNVISI